VFCHRGVRINIKMYIIVYTIYYIVYIVYCIYSIECHDKRAKIHPITSHEGPDGE